MMTSEEAFKQHRSEELPRFAQLEMSNSCNQRCVFCPHKDMQHRRPTLTWTQANELIDLIAPRVEQICPFLMEEPALNPKLRGILNYIKQCNTECGTTLYSNMTAWTPEQLRWLVDDQSLDTLSLSFYAPDEGTYSRLQPGPPDGYRRARANIQSLRLYRDEVKLPAPVIEAHYITMPELMAGLKGYAEWVARYADSFGLVPFDTFHGRIPDRGDNARYFGPPPAERAPCPRLWSGFNVLSTGDVVPCCLDYEAEHVCGNIWEQKPEEIWRGNKLNELRKLHVERRFSESSLCRDCTVWHYQHPPEWNTSWLRN